METPSNRYDEMADTIEAFLTQNGIERHLKGVPDKIIQRLRNGDFEKAKATLDWDGDKLGNDPELLKFLQSLFDE